MISQIEGIVVDVKDDKVTIDVNGELKNYVNNIYKLKVGEKIKFELRFLNELDKVVILDQLIN